MGFLRCVIHSAEDVIQALAKIDIMHSHIASADGMESGLQPGDDFYHAPYALWGEWLPRQKRMVYWMAFTGYKVRQPHIDALTKMGEAGIQEVPYQTLDEAEDPKTRDSLIKFRESKWANGDDVCEELYDTAFAKTMEALKNDPFNANEPALKYEIPSNWRDQRDEIVGKGKATGIQAVKLKQAPRDHNAEEAKYYADLAFRQAKQEAAKYGLPEPAFESVVARPKGAAPPGQTWSYIYGKWKDVATAPEDQGTKRKHSDQDSDLAKASTSTSTSTSSSGSSSLAPASNLRKSKRTKKS